MKAEDLSELEVLDENSIVQTLRCRFNKDLFYTYIGEILVAINPCKPLQLFDEKHHNEYKNLTVRSTKPPHLFWVADQAFRAMQETKRNQCILVSGESGAGKTESTKYMIRHLMKLSPSDDEKLLDKIVQINPLLEAFGNASTVMNRNSSRFGKFIELQYAEDGSLLGAKIDDYILEKSRVVHRSPGEKNFHVFYALFAGMSRDRLLYYFLEDPDCHRIMRDDEQNSSIFKDSDEFQYYQKMFTNLTKIMAEIGFSDEHISVIFLVLAAILHLANIQFVSCEETDGVTVADEYPLHAVAKLLGIEDEVELTEALISNVNYIKGERIQSWKSFRDANNSRDALAKDLYSRLFGWIVGQINRNIWTAKKRQSTLVRGPSISLLDLSGFENFPSNSFDQFFINVSNERLQQYFMEYIFPREQREYEIEGIEWRNIMYHSNDDVLDLLFKRPDGVLSLLDEESHFPQSNDNSFVQKLNKYCSESDRFVPSLRNKCCFEIQHYAEQVVYNAEGFLERNRDNLSSDLIGCMLNSNNEFIKDLFTASMSPTGTISDFASKCSSRPRLPSIWPSAIDPERLRESLSRQASLRIKRRSISCESIISSVNGKTSPTVTNHFKRSLSDLVTKLSQSQPLFVRCIKPNKSITTGRFEAELVRRQLLCNGLMEIAELRRYGYPVRILFDEFISRYGMLCESSDDDQIYGNVGRCFDILKAVNIEGSQQMGKTKIFLRNWQKDVLEDQLRKKISEREEQKRMEAIRRQSAASVISTRTSDSVFYSETSSPIKTPIQDGTIRDDLATTDNGLSQDYCNNKVDFESVVDTIDVNDSISMQKRRIKKSEDSKSTSTSVDLEEDFDMWRPYDIFQVSEREFEDNDYIFKEILKGIRVFLYLFFIVMILGCTVASKMSLLLITSGISQQDEQARGENIVLMLICISAPIGWNWFMSFMKILFGGKNWPSMKTFLVLLFFEGLQAFGMCLLLFRVLPSTDFFRGLVITFAVCQIPSLLKVIVHQKRPNPSIGEVVGIIMNIGAFLVQVSAIPFFTIGEFLREGNHTLLQGHNETHFTKTFVVCEGGGEWELPVSLVLISIGWWENYVSGEWTVFGKITIPFKHWRSILQDVRETSFFLIGPLKIGLCIFLSTFLTRDSVLVLPASGDFNATTSEFSSKGEEVGVSYSLLFIQLGCGIISTYLAGLACKLHMQKAAFALPLTLAPPVSLMLVYLQCSYQFLPAHWHVGGWFCPELDIYSLMVPLICAVLLWLSYAITVSHIWFPQCERMAKIEKLFITPHFESIFPDFTLTMRRRRNDKEIKVTGFDTFRYVGDDTYCEDIYSVNTTTPHVYACATMWHETRQEMTQLLKSLFRLDYVHCASKLAQEKFRIKDPDYYDLEMHIIFDDAFELDESVDKYVPNGFVRQLYECMEDAARSVVKGPVILSSPEKVATPYGGKLIWTMPGHTKLHVHMKDKNKMRHRKRWSQVMYLYYILGFKLFGAYEADKMLLDEMEKESSMSKVRQRKKSKGKKKEKSRPLKSLFSRMNAEQYDQAENTFLLTLDGDVDFKPDAVKLLIDRMKKNRKVGAVCGRIHPIGSGPMVWYQEFEYAVGHWLQKAAEHVFGCVLCCPGCFSLFRGSAIMDDNVLKMYTTKPTEARHYIQFEQGEDRWLCTLMLQQGHRIDYCAGSDALTFAPETFNEFFNQRRRWSPSTLANMMDLLSSWRDTVRINDNISRPYMLYQFVLMASTIIAPSTVILMITGAYHSVLKLDIFEAYLLSLLPVVIYLVICLTMKSNIQVMAAAAITALYAVIMMIATVGTIISIVTENFGSPNVVFLTGLTSIFFIAGILHPQEFFCLVYGALYFMVVPSTFILLTIFYLCNLNNVSWGTRETPKKLTKEEEEEIKRKDEEKKKKRASKSLLNRLGVTTLLQDAGDLLKSLLGTKTTETKVSASCQTEESTQLERSVSRHSQNSVQSRTTSLQMVVEDVVPPGWEPDPDHPYWVQMDCLGKGPVRYLSREETKFWRFMINKYLYPIVEDKQHKEKIKDDLISLKNNVVFIYCMINFLWTIITLQLQSMEDELKNFYIIQKYEPLSLIFLSIFAIAISLQFLSMFMHRWGTFLHLMSSTRIDWFKTVQTEEDFVRFVVNEAQRLQRMEPAPDYDDLPPDYDDDDVTVTTYNMPEEQYDELPSLPPTPDGTIKSEQNGKNRRHSGKSDPNIPLLQQIFEDRLENIHRKWKQGTLAFRHSEKHRFNRYDDNRFSQKDDLMREKMFKRSFKKNSCDETIPNSIKIDTI